eukprot:797744-Amorphochlora_amoeboformis.AAC.2
MHPKVCARLFLLQLAMSWLEVSQAQMCSGECVCPTVCHEGNMYRTCPRDESDECRFVLHNIANNVASHSPKIGDNRDFVITGQGVLQFSGNIPPFSLDATGSISFLWRPTKPAGNFEFAIKKYHNSNKSKIAGLSKTTFIVVVVLGVGIGLIILARCLQKAGFKWYFTLTLNSINFIIFLANPTAPRTLTRSFLSSKQLPASSGCRGREIGGIEQGLGSRRGNSRSLTTKEKGGRLTSMRYENEGRESRKERG